ncbi:MAG TPA: type II toxin-antitoxin system Phd/YefM family antitoxin [Candidatus Acidoferrales bacterium]
MHAKPKKRLQEVAISEFKAKCLSLVDQVNKTKTPLVVTRRGVPIVEVVPVGPDTSKTNWMGSMADVIKIKGDIVSPVIDLNDIEALKD